MEQFFSLYHITALQILRHEYLPPKVFLPQIEQLQCLRLSQEAFHNWTACLIVI